MAQVRRCNCEECTYNIYGTCCELAEITLDSNGNCDDFEERDETNE